MNMDSEELVGYAILATGTLALVALAMWWS